MVAMKRLLFLLCGSAVLLCGAELAGVKTVYVMPMARGMDQYLASRLASDHVLEVVTDPKLADAVLTDRIGEGFQIQLESFSPTPDPQKTETKKAAKEKSKDDDGGDASSVDFAETVNKLDNPALNSSFGRGKGTIFLVETKSRQVIWSTFDPAKGLTNRQLDRTASDIVGRLKKDLNPKSKSK